MYFGVVSDWDITDAIVTALEGGSNYWYFIKDISPIKTIKWDEELALSEKIAKAVLEHDLSFDIYDIEDPNEILGQLNKENIMRGVKMFLAERSHFDASEMDADDADAFFQYTILGELTFS